MDPYKVLGVNRSDSDETIKAAYRKLAKQYHPDKYRGHDLEDLASEKIKQINLAYDTIEKERAGGSSYSRGSGSGYTGNSGYTGGTGGNPTFTQIRQLIQLGQVNRAESMLDGMNNHNAEWHYLKGVILQRKGFYDGAKQHFTTARNMSPNNPEYQSAFASMNRNASSYGQQNYGGQQGTGGCGCCEVCAGLMCADCLCDCFGGGCC